LLVAVVGTVTWLGLMILGVPNALLLGILAGLLELIPNLGPALAAVPAVLIAYFQGSTHFALAPPWFALLVLILYVGIQQVENTVLVPRIIGGSVHLHPVVILIGVLGGAAVAGILGIFLAAPVLASVRVIGSHVYTKLLEPPGPATRAKRLSAEKHRREQPEEEVDDEATVISPQLGQTDDGSVVSTESAPTSAPVRDGVDQT
jgi:predicted PurR-regulated permease PerM